MLLHSTRRTNFRCCLSRLLPCLLPGLLLLSACHRNMVRLQVAPGSNQHVWRRPVSPGELGSECRDLLFPVEPPLGYARGRTSRLEGFQFNTRVRWNVAVEPVCSAVKGLHERHNRGEITLREFEEHREALSRAVNRLEDRRARLEAALTDYHAARDALLRADTDGKPAELWRQLQSTRKRSEDALMSAAQLVESALGEDNEQTSSPEGSPPDE